ncbi:MAG: YdcF family protein [Anaerolineae bacterium]|nr:YdcF family protein [Anaerolineae bacterium]
MLKRFIHLIPRRKLTLILSVLSLLTLGLLTLMVTRVYSADYAKNLIFTSDNVPQYPVAIIFGAWVDNDGQPSAVLADRVMMGTNLYKAGKVKALLLTGDNHIDSYNEPEAMRQYALSLGVPESALVLDYAGFRTYDSCYRAHAIFKVDQAILVTQAFHLDRALLTCNNLGVMSVGVAADAVRPEGYSRSMLLTSEVREFPSTAMTFIDLISGKKPYFLGDPLPIFGNR